MDWYRQSVFYEIYLRAFSDGNGDGQGDFRGLTEKLDYFSDLGVDCLWLLPTYPSPLVDDGYDISDYYGVHPAYGTLDDFQRFLREAHDRGLRVISDLVLNHTSNQHPWFLAARSSPDNPYRDYYVWSDTDEKYREARIIFLDHQRSNWEWDPVAQQYYFHRFYAEQPDLNYDNPAVRQAMKDIMRYWMDMGLDGFRADAVPYLIKRDGTNCENLIETHLYLKELRHIFDTEYPGRILLAEANQWPDDVRPYFGSGDEFHMAFHFPLMPRIYMAIAQADYRPIVNILKATPPIPETTQWCTFLRNHDELTLEMVTPEEREFLWNTYAPIPRMRLNLGIRRRLAPLMGGDRRKIELLNSIILTLPGSPILYYGDEIGMGDNIWLRDRDGVRTPMQWTGDTNAGFSTAPADQLYSQPIDDEQFGYRLVNVETQRADPQSLWHTIRRMIAMRKQHPAFGLGEIELIETTNPAALTFIRSQAGERILVLHNLSDQPQRVAIDRTHLQAEGLRDLITDSRIQGSPEGRQEFSLLPYQYSWFIMEKAPAG